MRSDKLNEKTPKTNRFNRWKFCSRCRIFIYQLL